MKRLIAIILALTLVLSLGITASAAGNDRHCRQLTDAIRTCLNMGRSCSGVCRDMTHCAFVDADGDGVCDNCTGTSGHCPYVDENGDKVCDLCGKRAPKGGVRDCGYGNGACDGTGPVNNGICDSTGAGYEDHHSSSHHSSGHHSRG